MKKTLKQILSVILILCMMGTTFALIPVSAETSLENSIVTHYDFEGNDPLEDKAQKGSVEDTLTAVGTLDTDYEIKNGVFIRKTATNVLTSVQGSADYNLTTNAQGATYFLRFKIDENGTGNGDLFSIITKANTERALRIAYNADGTTPIIKIWAGTGKDGTKEWKTQQAYSIAKDTWINMAVSFAPASTSTDGVQDSTLKICLAADGKAWAVYEEKMEKGATAMSKNATPTFFKDAWGNISGHLVSIDDFRVYNKALSAGELQGMLYEFVIPTDIAPTMKNGAAVRLVKNSQGIRFTSKIPEVWVEGFNYIKDENTEVTLGTVIAPLDHIRKAYDFTMAELEKIQVNGEKYVNIIATDAGKEVKDGMVTFRAALVNLKEYNTDRAFAARSYIRYTVDGTEYIRYSDYSQEDHVRSMKEIAVLALQDIQSSQTGEYTELFQGGYSCYNETERTALKNYAKETIVLSEYVKDCAVVYHSDDGFSENVATRLKNAILTAYPTANVVLRDAKTDATVSVHEFLIGNTGRDESFKTAARLYKGEAFLAEVCNGKFVLAANTVSYPKESDQTKNTTHKDVNLFWAVAYVETLLTGSVAEYHTHHAGLYTAELDDMQHDRTLVEAYQAIYGTYNSYLEVRLEGADSGFSTDAIADQEKVDALIAAMGVDSAVFYVGSSNVLHQGYIRKCDPASYAAVAEKRNSELFVPSAFISTYFPKLPIDSFVSDGYVNLSAAVNASSEYVLAHAVTNSNLYVLRKTDTFTDYAKYVSRIKTFFEDKYQENAIDTEQTRVEIESIGDFPEYVPDWEIEEHDTTYSPCIATVTENGKSVIYVAYEYAAITGGWTQNTCTLKIKKSEDGGKSWKDVGTVENLQWASMIAVNNTIYLMGNRFVKGGEGGAMIAKVNSDGTVSSALINTVSGIGGGGPGAMIVHDGKVFKAYNKKVVYASVSSNLLDPANWNASNALSDVITTTGVCEGNLVVMNGEIYNIMRVDNQKITTLENGHAVIAKLVNDGNGGYIYQAVDGVGESGLIEFPTSWTKFAIRYDAASRTYLALSNIKTDKSAINRQRSVLCLATSTDLIHWTIKEYVLVDRQMMNPVCSASAHGFQYVDFVIDGDDLIMAVREASGRTALYHDGNYTTFYRIEDYQDLIANGS